MAFDWGLPSLRGLIQASADQIPLKDRIFHCCVTSPPYYQLRAYADAEMQKVRFESVTYRPMAGMGFITIPSWHGALGHEPNPEWYIGHLVAIFREVKRVMRDDSVTWIVIADSYEDGNLVGIPQRLFFALRADGWIIRNDLCWHKTNPMPESVAGHRWERHRIKLESGRPPIKQNHLPDDGRRNSGLRGNLWADVQNQPNAEYIDCPGCDKCAPNGGYVLRRGSWRHTRAQETVLMCVKSMGYWANQEAVREPHERRKLKKFQGNDGLLPHERKGKRHNQPAARERGLSPTAFKYPLNPGGRNPRSVLTVASEPYQGEHYAAFPTALIAPLIRATCPRRCCPLCGAGWAPVVERETNYVAYPDGRHIADNGKWDRTTRALGRTSGNIGIKAGPIVTSNLLGFRQTCECRKNKAIPGIVLDCFCGSGTTLQVAKELGLRAVGMDLSHSYLDKQAKIRARLGSPSGALDDLPLFHQNYIGE